MRFEILNYISLLPRRFKQLLFVVIDSFVLVIAIWISFCIRLGQYYVPSESMVWLIFLAPLFALPIFFLLKIYKDTIRFIGFNTVWIIIKAVSLYGLVWGLIALISGEIGFPRSVILINWLVAMITLISWRLILRWLLSELFVNSTKLRKNVLIYGAGEAGRQIILALSQSKEYNPISFIDDDKSKCHESINRLEVNHSSDIKKIISLKNVSVILIAIPSLAKIRRKEIIDFLEPFPVNVLSLPGIDELATGNIKISDIREIDIKELLGRPPVPANTKLLSLNISNKNVMVTGAGGSIGSELCRQILNLMPNSIILYDISEFSLYSLEKELNEINLDKIRIYPILGSVVNKVKLKSVINLFNVGTIYHSAAYKHVPIVELNNAEGIRNNVLGTLNCALAAIENDVSTFVMISTDKAVRPTNTMGATKRLSEMIIQALSNLNSKNDINTKNNSNNPLIKDIKTTFSIVRFGNVLNSSGSVIPLFKEQIKSGGPITVTDEEVVRFFMSTDEAVSLVMQAGAMGKEGDVFVLDMGEPILIKDLAIKMIKLSGLTVKDKFNVTGDIEIKYSGLRHGEKLYEELLIGKESRPTDHPMIMRAQEPMLPWEDLKQVIDSIEKVIDKNDSNLLRNILIQVIPEFAPQSDIVDLLHEKIINNKL